MSSFEKQLKTKLQLALTKERLYSYSSQRGHPTGKTYEIKGVAVILFFALAEYNQHTAINNYLGTSRNNFFHKALYGPFTKDGIAGETQGIGQLLAVIKEAAEGTDLAEYVFETVCLWVETYIKVLDLIPSVASLLERTDPVKIRDNRLAAITYQTLVTMAGLMDLKQPNRFARTLNCTLRETGTPEQYLVTGFRSDTHRVVIAPVSDSTFEQWHQYFDALDEYVKLYTKVMKQSAPPQPPQQRRVEARRRY
jgi:hypothetical protein